MVTDSGRSRKRSGYSAEPEPEVVSAVPVSIPNADAIAKLCIEIIRKVRDDFLSEEYAVGQPLSSLMERFACDEAMKAISLVFGLDTQENAK